MARFIRRTKKVLPHRSGNTFFMAAILFHPTRRHLNIFTNFRKDHFYNLYGIKFITKFVKCCNAVKLNSPCEQNSKLAPANTKENTEPTKAPFVGVLADMNSGPSRTFD